MAEQRVVNFSGNVQGVGFRFTACRVAGGYDVTGFVRNLSDGRVKCVIEGEKKEIDAFLAELGRQMSYHIRKTTQQTAPPSGSYHTFGVEY